MKGNSGKSKYNFLYEKHDMLWALQSINIIIIIIIFERYLKNLVAPYCVQHIVYKYTKWLLYFTII